MIGFKYKNKNKKKEEYNNIITNDKTYDYQKDTAIKPSKGRELYYADDESDYNYNSYYPYGGSYGGYYNNYNYKKKDSSWERKEWNSYSWNDNSYYKDRTYDKSFVVTPNNFILPSDFELSKDCHINQVERLKDMYYLAYHNLLNEKFDNNLFKKDSQINPDVISVLKTAYETLSSNPNVNSLSIKDRALFMYNMIRKMNNGEDNLTYRADFNEELSDYFEFKSSFEDTDQWDPVMKEIFHEFNKNEKIILTLNIRDIINKISLFKDFGNKFLIRAEDTFKYVSNSEIQKLSFLRRYDQLSKVNMLEFAKPQFNKNLAIKNLIARLPILPEKKKQNIIILVDFSGSMQTHFKQQWVYAIIADRLRYAMEEEATVYFSYYCNSLVGRFHKISNKDEVIKFMPSYSTSPNGGDTNIGNIVNNCVLPQIKSKNFFSLGDDLDNDKTELLIICDGQDTVKAPKSKMKTNIISIQQLNNQMKNFSINSGGAYVYIEPLDYGKGDIIRKWEKNDPEEGVILKS